MIWRLTAVLLTIIPYSVCYGQEIKTLDSLTRPASLKYKHPSLFKRLILGNNYRKEWSKPVKAPLFHLSSSGMKILSLGGGQQTKSLRLEDEKGKEWVLRTVDKDVTNAMPGQLRGTIAQKIVQDMVSGAHPYAPIVVGALGRAAGIIAPFPKLFYVADEIELGPYREYFADQLCFLEEREPAWDPGKTTNTTELLEELSIEHDHLVIQKTVLKARLLDMLVADWDRHSDQWRWGEIDSAGNKLFYAIPRDRDQAFFNSNGLLVTIARLVSMKHLVGFKSKTRRIKNLNFKAWDFDRTFLNELDASDWKNAIRELQSAIDDKVIADAVRKIPKEVYSISGPTIEHKLKSRRDGLEKDVMRYYLFLSNVVNINGTREEEIFRLSKENANLVIEMTDGQGKKNIYKRSFNPGETRQIFLNGLGGNDRFVIDKGVDLPIRIGINGGQGEDEYVLDGKIKTRVFN